MNYRRYRESLIKGHYDYQLERLMTGFVPTQKTVILLPGGMGSQLERTGHAHPRSPNIITGVSWLDMGVGKPKLEARHLEIDHAGADKDRHIIAAHGPITLPNYAPYGPLADRARARDWNFGVFGFDWRRPIRESSDNFKRFILNFRQRVRDDFEGADPIPSLTIVTHSMGGLVATHALNDVAFRDLGFNAVMTIAAPFYGSSTHQQRYFIGEPLLNDFYGARTMVRIIASLPGPYTLMLLPKSVFDRDHERIGLSRYPQFDRSGNVSDPYDRAMMRRWPRVVREHRQHINRARLELIDIAAPIHPSIARKFFNVRSALDTETPVELIWNDIDGDKIDPAVGPSPLEALTGPGDGTVPAWSAFHAHCANRHDLAEARDHTTLLEHEEVLTLIEHVVTTGRLPTGPGRRKRRGKGRARAPVVASRAKLARVLSKWAARSADQPLPRELLDRSVQRAFVASLMDGPKPRVVGTSPLSANATKPARRR